MSGNVWEWCSDWFNEDEYKNRQGLAKDPQGPKSGISRVLRGGSYSNEGRPLRCAWRSERNPNYRNEDVGFRVVCVASITSP